MKLSEEERNLLMLFAGFICESTGCSDQHCFFPDAVDDFVKKFDSDPRTYRQEIAPPREPMPEERPE